MKILLPLLLTVFALCGGARAADLAKDMAGESCALSGAVSLSNPAALTCGGVAAGSVRLVSLGAPAGAARIATLTTAARAAIATADVTCSDTALDADTVLLLCAAGSTTAPRLVVARATPKGVFVGDSLPGAGQALSDAIAGESGAAVPAGAILARVRDKFPARLLDTGAGDYAHYLAQTALARQRSALGNFAGAETAYRDALDVEGRLFGDDSPAVALTTMELALQVSNQARPGEAAALFRRVTPAINAMPDAAVRARLSSYLALDAANRRDYASALKFSRAATAARRADVEAARTAAIGAGAVPAASVEQEAELAHALRIDAEMAMRLGDYPAAEAAAQEALYIMTGQPGMPLAWRADIVLLMGEINARLGKVVVAERDFVQAVEMDRKLFGGSGPTAGAELELAKFYSDQQLYPAALTAYRKAFADLDSESGGRAQLMPDQVAPFLAAGASSGLTGAERVQADQDMVLAGQRIESGVEGQTIARVAARQAIADPNLKKQLADAEDAQRRLASLRMSLAVERAIPPADRDPAREKTLLANLETARTQDASVQAALRKAFPNYQRLVDPGPVPLDELRRHLRAREGFVSFVIGVHASYVLLLTGDALTVRAIPATRDSLADDIADLRSGFSVQLGGVQAFSLKNAHALYQQLLGPVDKELSGLDRIVVATSGDLASLPFALLVTADPQDNRAYRDAAWLVRRAAIAQVPSARAFVALRDAAHVTAPRPLLALGNPVFTVAAKGGDALAALSGNCQQGGPANAALLRALPPLPDTAGEIQRVAADLKAGASDLLLGADATEAALRTRPLEQYAVLYFATHGMLPGELHCQAEPALVLSPPATPATTTQADGLLTASEIAALKLNAELVVLSACNTAAAGGTAFGGGALDGLSDAFFEAGAHAVLASQWKVSSLATAQLMGLVFAALAADPSHDVAAALRSAQLAMLAAPATSHPFNWAAFTLIGAGATHTGS